MNNPNPKGSTRRRFLQTSTAAVLTGAVAPYLNLSAQKLEVNSDTLKVGLVGCGGRGTGAAAQALAADKNVMLTAMGDVFSNQLERSLKTLKENTPDKIQVFPDKCFVGLDAYTKVIDSGVDVVLLATPPGFRPLHLKAAIEANKHVFCEKPMATDAPGVRSVLATAALAREKKRSLVSGFCWRYDFARRAFYRQIHDGGIGDIRSIYATFYTSPVKPMPPANERRDQTDIEWQLRNWYNFVWLCGDGLVEQAVHSVDKICWAMKDQPPLKAVATGGRQIPNPGGNIYDHFAVYYEYPNGARAFLGCRQQPNCYGENADYLMGSRGTGIIGRRDAPEIQGEKPWRYTGPKNAMYQTEHDELFASIRDGKPLNDGEWMTQSTLMAIMGRMAAYTGEEISWAQAQNSKEDLFPANMDWNMTLPVPPMATPGKTKYS
jgi:predicted dehydrogenase